MALAVSIRKHGTIPVLELTGRIVDIDVKKFSRRLAALHRQGYALIVVDLSKVNFIDSHGLGILAYYHTLMQRDKRDLVVFNADPQQLGYVSRLFDLTNLRKVMHVISSLQELGINPSPPGAGTIFSLAGLGRGV